MWNTAGYITVLRWLRVYQNVLLPIVEVVSNDAQEIAFHTHSVELPEQYAMINLIKGFT
ncbi:MAG: hypothetical protein AAFW00_28765 [Bacteroidota bacterium]